MVARLLLALLAVSLSSPKSRPKPRQAQTLVIQGGTLIDGTGRAAIENSVIVIEGNRFRAIGRAGEVQIPAVPKPSTCVARQCCPVHRRPLPLGIVLGRVYLICGITTCCRSRPSRTALGAGPEGGTEMGRIRGPRLWPTARRLAPARATSRPKARAPGAAT